jgi:glycine hydroxymethyltransferase
VLTGGTDVHLVLVDLRETDPALSGREAEDRLHDIGITVNRNAVPFDPRPPIEASGLRIGTPALATRGLQLEDFTEVGRIMASALTPAYESLAGELAERARAVAERYPLYEELAASAIV